ncbi:MAG: hypothetical protein OEU09_16655, partial [Rhodospirillales bacterium]|nr:hypothetical protein [Rhodospirillales bacterium]
DGRLQISIEASCGGVAGGRRGGPAANEGDMRKVRRDRLVRRCAAAFGRRARLASWLLAGVLTACANPHYPVLNEDDADYKAHLDKIRTCDFGNQDPGPYPGYAVENHILEASEQGTVAYPAKGGARNQFRPNFLRIMFCYRNFLAWQKQSARDEETHGQVLIYFNGGLNPADVLHEQAAVQVPRMLEDGYYPIFLAWPTGALDTYLEQIAFVRNGTRHSSPQYLSTPLYLLGDIGQGLVRAPVNYMNQLQRFVSASNPFDDSDKREFFLTRAEEICRDAEPADDGGPGHAAASEDKVCEKTDVNKFGIVNCEVTAEKNLLTGQAPDQDPGPSLLSVPYYGLFPVRFVATPLVDAFGKTMWENMVRRTRTTVRSPVEYNIHLVDDFKPREISAIEDDKRRFPHGIGAFARFFTMLQYCIDEDGDDTNSAAAGRTCYPEVDEALRSSWRNVELTIIGHSMGSIVMNELIPEHPDLPYRNLVFMAAAASVRDTARAISPIIERANAPCPRGNCNDKAPNRPARAPLRFYNLMLHPRNDALELESFGALPSGSLLEWVDEMFEGPKTVIDRTMGKWRNLRATKHVFPREAQENMLFRVFSWDDAWSSNQVPKSACDQDPSGGASQASERLFKPPTTHGAFNDNRARFWCPYFWGADTVGWWRGESDWNPRLCGAGS